ncbi:MAG TPA: hypothetical protein VGN09_03395, partial [Vicinamibacteria bacterium]
MTGPATAAAPPRGNRSLAARAALLLAFGLLDLGKGLYFLRHYPQAAPFDIYYNVGLRLMRDLMASRSAGDLGSALRAMKGLAYLAGAGALYGPWAILKPGDFQWMRQGLAVADAVNLVLAAALVLAWTGRRFAAATTALLWLIFPGYTLNLVRGYPEPLVVLAFLLSLAAFTRADRRRRASLYALSGFLFLYSVFIRVQVMPFFMLVSGVLLAAAARWALSPSHRRRTIAFLAGALPVIAVWALLRVEVDDPARLESFSFHAFQRVYPHGFWLYLDTDGWMGPYSLRQYPFYLALVEAARGEPALLTSSARQWTFAGAYVLRHLDESARTVLINLYRFFARPTNDYKWDFPYPYGLQVGVQGLVSLVGLAGLLRARRPHVPWALLAVYVVTFSLLYAISHIEPRYHLPVMAVLLMTAGLWLDEARDWVGWVTPQRRAVAVALAIASGGALAWWLARAMTRPLPALILHHAAVLGAAAALFLFFHGMGKGEPRGSRVAATTVAGLAAACVLAVGFTDVSWHGRRAALTPGSAFHERIILSEEGLRALRGADEAFAVFDLARVEGDQRCLRANVNGTDHGGEEFFPAMPRFPLATTAGQRDPAWFVQWWALPLSVAERQALTSAVDITLSVSPGCRSTGMTLGVESFLRQNGRDYEGPSFEDWRKVSVYRLLYDGEHRLPIRRRRDAIERRSGRIERGRFQPMGEDLRIGLLVLRPGGARLDWETPAAQESGDTAVAFRAESGRGGEARLGVGNPGSVPEVGFPLAAREPFAREAGPIRLSYVPERLGEDRAEGLYLLRVPGRLVRAGEPLRLSVRIPTRLSTDERYFAVRPAPA